MNAQYRSTELHGVVGKEIHEALLQDKKNVNEQGQFDKNIQGQGFNQGQNLGNKNIQDQYQGFNK